MASLHLAVQYALPQPGLPTRAAVRRWAKAALARQEAACALTIRIVDEAESRALNQTYRRKTSPTNVLAFPMPLPELASSLLGDIVICAPVVAREAHEQDKPLEAHWAHIVIHGILHLLGYDHDDESQAQTMENLEVEILAKLGYSNPYGDSDDA